MAAVAQVGCGLQVQWWCCGAVSGVRSCGGFDGGSFCCCLRARCYCAVADCCDVKVQIRGRCCNCSGESGGFSSPLVVAGADCAREVRCGEDGGDGTADSNQARRC